MAAPFPPPPPPPLPSKKGATKSSVVDPAATGVVVEGVVIPNGGYPVANPLGSPPQGHPQHGGGAVLVFHHHHHHVAPAAAASPTTGAPAAYAYPPPHMHGAALQQPMLGYVPAPQPAAYPHHFHGVHPQMVIMPMPPHGGAPRVVIHTDFQTGLTRCLGTKGASTCLNAFFLPYCTAGRQLNHVTSDGTNSSMFHWTCVLALAIDVATVALAVFLPTVVGLRWVLAPALTFQNYITRTNIRRKFGMQPNCLQDLCVSWLCPFCAIGQQQSELDLRGWFPGAFCDSAPASRAPIMIEMM